jgi:hypothetical protein
LGERWRERSDDQALRRFLRVIWWMMRGRIRRGLFFRDDLKVDLSFLKEYFTGF